jgi:hypothetical protein
MRGAGGGWGGDLAYKAKWSSIHGGQINQALIQAIHRPLQVIMTRIRMPSLPL